MFAKSTARWPAPSITVLDDIYKDPQGVYEWAKSQEFFEPEPGYGWRSRKSKIFAGLRSRLQKHFGAKVSFLEPDGHCASGTAYLGFSKGKRKEQPFVHWDEPENAYLAMVYITPNIKPEYGTAFWTHKATRLDRAPVRDDEKRLGMSCEAILARFNADGTNRSKWTETACVGYRWNRALVFPAYLLHSAKSHYGGTKKNGRIHLLHLFRLS